MGVVSVFVKSGQMGDVFHFLFGAGIPASPPMVLGALCASVPLCEKNWNHHGEHGDFTEGTEMRP